MNANGHYVKRFPRILLPLTVAASLALLAGCGGPDPAKQIESAKANIAKGVPKTAIIELKDALQKEPGSGEARFLLGKALLSIGDAGGAEVELRKALERHHAEDQVVPEIARAKFALGQHEKLKEEFGKTQLSDPQAVADLKVTLARAYAILGRREQARSEAQAALAAVPGYGPATLFMVREQADSGDVDGALSVLGAELAKRPQDFEAWQLKADMLYFVKGDANGALVAYRQAIAAKPSYLAAHAGAMSLLLNKNDLEGARTQLAQMRASAPNDPQTLYFEGTLALLERNLDRVQTFVQQLQRVAPDNPRVLQLDGLMQFERGNFVQAENMLSKALQSAPELGLARRALAQIYLKRAEPVKALDVLKPLLKRPNPDAAIWKMMAQAHVQQGELAKAEAAFAEAARIDPGNASRRTELAISKVLRGDTDEGEALLRSLAAGKDDASADLPLIATLMKKQDFAGAFKAIDALERKQPTSPVAANLRAQVLLSQGDRTGAIRSFEQALKIQPSFLPAGTALAQLAFADNKPAEAQKVLDDVVKADPKSSEALLTSLTLKARTGTSRADIITALKAAVQRMPQTPPLRLALIDSQLESQDAKGALESARQAAAALPDDLTLLEALGRAQAASGDTNQAVATFNKLAQSLPASPTPLMRLAQVQLDSKNLDGAVQSAKRALAIAPDNLPAQQLLVNVYMAKGDATAALDVARQVQQQRPKQDQGYLFAGTIEGTRRRFDQAVQAYRAGIKATGGTSKLAIGLHTALTAMKQRAQADREEAAWLQAHPQDTAFRFYLGDLALAQRDLAVAEARYREVLKLQPAQAQALNNVAWLMATAKKPGAVALAEKANQLEPGRSTFMDTLALALAAEGQPAKAVQMMRQAITADANNPLLRLNLARILIQAGDKSTAKTELQTLADLGDKFGRQNEVAALLKSL